MRGQALASLAVVAAAALVLAGFRWTTPGYEILTGPIGASGVQGQTVAGRTFSAKIDDIRFADRVRLTRYGKTVERDTDGVWAVVSAELAALSETAVVHAATWRGASGRLYAASRRVEGAPGLLQGKILQPGLPSKGLFVFELPPDEVQGGILLLSAAASPRLDSELRIRLSPESATREATLELARVGG